MTHYYSDAQKAATRILIDSYSGDNTIQGVTVLGSVYMPLYVFVKIRRVEIDDNGGGGITTDYVAIDYDGMITRNANINLIFSNEKARILVFSELIPVNEP